MSDYSEPVKDPVWRNIALSPGLLAVVETPAFQKLNGIKQLGPTYLVYPGATHTRLNHSLGVLHIARRMVMELLHRGAGRLSLEGVKAFLCAALLHDLGHYPFAHSLKELEVKSHEALTAARVLEPDFRRLIHETVGTDPELVAAIVDRSLRYSGAEAVELYRNLLSGVLDPDKLDYLNRDAYFCGVPYGIQDVDFVLAEIVPHRRGLAISRKGLGAVESILFSKYLMYRSVYWHKTVRIATAMIKKAVLMALGEGELRVEDLYWLDDHEFFSHCRSSYPPLALLGRVRDRRLYKVVAGVAFDEGNPRHRLLRNLRERLRFEGALARALGAPGRAVPAEAVIVDLPESISFEIDLPILPHTEAGEEAGVPFGEAGSVFDSRFVLELPRTLRRLTVIVDPEIVDAQAAGEAARNGLDRGW